MKATLACLGALCLAGAAGSAAQAQVFFPYRPVAPDACGPGYYGVGVCGMVYGPNYCLHPPFPPFNGARPCFPKGGDGNGPYPTYPSHPFARGPRDFFMID